MSFQSNLLIALQKMTAMKRRLAQRSFAQLQQQLSVPEPPEQTRNSCSTEKIAHDHVSGYWLNRGNAPAGTLVYLHGGAYIYGPVGYQWKYITHLCRESGMAALVIDYKKLPDFAFPHALQDVVAVLAAFLASKTIPGKYFLLGDSSGGGLALAACYELRRQEIRQPEKLVLLSRCVDIGCRAPAGLADQPSDPVVSRLLIEKVQTAYCADQDLDDPLISPLFGAVRGLPPILLQCGTRELLLWSLRRFYFKCLEAGVPIRYEEYPGMIHVFATMGFLPEAKQAQRTQLDFLRDVRKWERQ